MTCIVAVCLGADAWIGMLDSGALKDSDGIRRRAIDRGAADCRRAPIGRMDWLDFLEGGEGGTASADQA